MAIQNYITTMRFDKATDEILNNLTIDLNFNKSQIIRRSLRLLNELHEIKKQFGEILVRTEKGEMLLVLLG